MESAITSRLISDARIPSLPMVMPSEIEIGVEFQRRAARGADSGPNMFSQFPKVIVAGTNLNPGIGDADQGF